MEFLLTRPLRDVTGSDPGGNMCAFISLLTRPLRDVTTAFLEIPQKHKFLLTRPLRDVTMEERRLKLEERISTHTPLAGRDLFGM